MSTLYMGVIAPSIVLLPIIIGIFKMTFWNHSQRVVFFYMIFCLFFNVIAVLTAFYGINNMPLLHLYTILEFCILSYVFVIFFRHRLISKMLISINVFFIIYAAYYALENSLYHHNVYPRFLGSILIVFLCLVYLVKNFNKIPSPKLNFKLIISVGLLLYYASASALFGFSGKLMELTRSTEGVLWNIHATVMLLMYLIFAYAYWKYIKPT